jgi:hypothetical protein
LFNNGIDHYKNKRFEEAQNVFSDILKINQRDSVAAFYVNRCRNNIQKGIPDDWSGIEVFDAK